MKIRLLQSKDLNARGSDLAYKFTDPNNIQGKPIWIPKSVVKHISRDPFPDNKDMVMCTVDVEDWFAEKNDL